MIENGEIGSKLLMKDIYCRTGRAHVVGVTGPLGTGKSSIVDKLVKSNRERGKRVAVLAVDPSSPISGGAILGDRVRMLEHALDPGVYIRSMASRGDEGGLSRASKDAVRILDAAGFDLVFVETVGIGQTEVEIVNVADTVVVVLMPELGDEIQAIKAGLIEIGDIFAVNKSDLPGADKTLYYLGSVLSTKKSGWSQVAIKVSAATSEGLPELVKAIDGHLDFVRKEISSSAEVSRRIAKELSSRIIDLVVSELEAGLPKDADFSNAVEKILKKEIDPGTAATQLVQKYVSKNGLLKAH